MKNCQCPEEVQCSCDLEIRPEEEGCPICGGRVAHTHVVSEPLKANTPHPSYEQLVARNKLMSVALVKLTGMTADQLIAVAATAKETQDEGHPQRTSNPSATGGSTDQSEVPS
jgi:hypothetical protein